VIFRVRHVTRYSYETPVDLASHLLHLCPRVTARQSVLRASLVVDPPPTGRRDGTDYFGNATTWLFHEEPHARFVVSAVADVAVVAAPPVPPGPAWESVAVAVRTDPACWAAAEFALPSPGLKPSSRAGAWIAASFPPGRPIGEAVMDVTRRIYADFRFRAGVTGLSTSVEQVLATRMGVCQDFTNLMIAGLRWLGIPARYVSGYIRTYPRDDAARLLGADQSHAWVAVWLGPACGWVEFDPTNGIPVSGEHVLLGHGRDYRDISPVRGMILGGGDSTMAVEVDLLVREEADARGIMFPGD